MRGRFNRSALVEFGEDLSGGGLVGMPSRLPDAQGFVFE
jgi:hypothetical protein